VSLTAALSYGKGKLLVTKRQFSHLVGLSPFGTVMLAESSDSPDFVGDVLQLALGSCQGLLQRLVVTEEGLVLDWC
jgi:hypothetical protein